MSTTTVRNRATTWASSVSGETWALVAVLGVGLLLRVLFILSDGFHNDVASFESWSLTLAEHPLWEFYGKAGFADYPPGYFFILWFVGAFYKAILALHVSDPGYTLLKVLIKVPAIAFDLLDSVLIYKIARRFASPAIALLAAAFLALNPAAIYTSSYWGQVDSVSAGFVLLACWQIVSRPLDNAAQAARQIRWAWVFLAYATLIKPPAVLLVPLLIAYAFVSDDAVERTRRIRATLEGMGLGLALAYVAALIFHPAWNPLAVLSWLYQRYAYGSSVYPYNSVNAFNLHAIFRPFWLDDRNGVFFASLPLGPMWLWGDVLVVGAVAILIGRYLQRRDDQAFLECAMLLSLGFFMLATRMHERYVYNGFVLMMPLIAFGRRYVWGAALISLTLLVNLAYSFHYMIVMEQKIPGSNPMDLWPALTHPLSLLNVAVFFTLGYVYLGGTIDAIENAGTKAARAVQLWFSPREALASLTRLDWLILSGFTLASFLLCSYQFWLPWEKVFDEVYYPVSGAQYLEHKPVADFQFPMEWTHPPLTKLIITLSMILFGGLHGLGNTPVGWRFLNVVIGALSVGLLYAFGKRLFNSTLWASVAAFMLLFDGFHFVQSRISTPEITVAFFTLCVLYAFYRYWIAAQIRVRDLVENRFGGAPFVIVMAAGTVLAIAVAAAINALGTQDASTGPQAYDWARYVTFVYLELGVYLVARLVVPRQIRETGTQASYADGTRVTLAGGAVAEITTLDERRLGRDGGALTENDLSLRHATDGTLTYATPEGTAVFSPAGTMSVEGTVVRSRDAWTWFWILTVCMGLLAASKWNGLFDFFVVWGLAGAVTLQRYLRRPALFGNPFGFPIDVVIGGMLFVALTIYSATYLPNVILEGKTPAGIVQLQQQMYWYHHNLRATHPYSSSWWEWPLLFAPISYYYHDFRPAAQSAVASACCVAEIIALPNPLVWWFGIVSVPFMAWLGWTKRHKGYLLLAAAYFIQWLPWIGSPRLAFEYHFYPNLAVIVLANAAVLKYAWERNEPQGRWVLYVYLAAVLATFAFFFPILAAQHITYAQWNQRMWLDNWIALINNTFHVNIPSAGHGVSWIKPN